MNGRVAYIAGPYRADSRRGIWQNIRRAAEVGVEVARKGYAVIVPHCNSHMPELLGNIGDQYWLDADLEIMVRCDLVVLVPNWRNSSGTQAEVKLAKERGIPVYELEDLPDD